MNTSRVRPHPAKGVIAVAMASPADLSEEDWRRVAGPLVAQMASYVERVAP